MKMEQVLKAPRMQIRKRPIAHSVRGGIVQRTKSLARVAGKAAVIAKRGSHIQTVAEVVGEDAVPIVQYLKGKKNISEFKIAESIRAEVNAIRKMLYAMQASNLVSYYRKKDRQKGWYISYWTLKPESFDYLALATKQQRLQQLKERLHKEEANQGLFYICPSLCVRLEFDKAAEISFKCPECGSMLQHQDNTKTIEQLRSRISELEARK